MGEGLPPVGDDGLRRWFVAGAIIESDDGVLLVQNRRRGGHTDWSTPGGVVEAGESTTEGLAREVVEETGINVLAWQGPIYSVEALAIGMGWHLEVEVYRAIEWEGTVEVDDPDGIVIDAQFVPLDRCHDHLATNSPWVREPMSEWLDARWTDARHFRYSLTGEDRTSMVVTRH